MAGTGKEVVEAEGECFGVLLGVDPPVGVCVGLAVLLREKNFMITELGHQVRTRISAG